MKMASMFTVSKVKFKMTLVITCGYSKTSKLITGKSSAKFCLEKKVEALRRE
jgi:hypothetical protein